jgi:sugar phosphate permease
MEAEPRPRSSSLRSRVFAVTWLTYAGYYLCRKNLGVALPLLNTQVHIPEVQLANVVFGYSLLYAVSQFVLGPLVDRYGSRRMVGLGMSLICLSNLLMSLSLPVQWLIVLAALNGLGQATGWSGLVRCVGEWFEPGDRGVMMSWWSTNYAFGGFVATVFAAYAATNTVFLPDLGWRRAFIFPSVLLFLIEICFLVFVPASSKRNAVNVAGAPSRRIVQNPLFRNPVLWLVSSSYFLLELTRYAFLFWLPLYLTSQLLYSVQNASFLASLFELVGVAGSVIAGYLSDRVFQARRFPVSALMLAGFSLFIFIVPHLARYGMWQTAFAISMMGMFCYGPDTLLSGVVAQDIGGSEYAGTAAGFIDGFGHLGSIISPYAVVYISKAFGWDNLFLLLGAGALSAAAILCFRWNFLPADMHPSVPPGELSLVSEKETGHVI